MPEQIEVQINTLGAQGDGIGNHLGKPVFVPGAAPGDRVLVEIGPLKKNGYYGALKQVLKYGNARREPECVVFGKCGGCQLQYLADKEYKDWLTDRASMGIAHHGFSDDVLLEPIVSPERSRRRVAFKAFKTGKNTVFGFNKKQSHQIVDLKDCLVTRDEITSLINPLRKLLNAILTNRMQAEVHVTITATGIDILVDAAMELDLAARELMVEFANEHDVAAIHWRDQGFLDPVIILRAPMMNLSGVRTPLAPAAFIQATEQGEKAIVTEVLKACEGAKRVVDLFCGIGTFTLPLAKKHQVLAVEASKQALEALQGGANMAAGLKQIVVKHRDLYRRPLSAKELSGFDAVVFDPPRAGAKEQALELAKSDVKTIVAVSCNPNTFSRDAGFLAEGGYVLERVTPIDQFLWSPHLELVGVFTRP